MIRSLEKEKQMLQGQMRDIEWRLDQESKVRCMGCSGPIWNLCFHLGSEQCVTLGSLFPCKRRIFHASKN